MKSIITTILWLMLPSYLIGQTVSNNQSNATYIGAYKSAKISYGRIYQLQRDTVNAEAVNYMGGIYFLVGANMLETYWNMG